MIFSKSYSQVFEATYRNNKDLKSYTLYFDTKTSIYVLNNTKADKSSAKYDEDSNVIRVKKNVKVGKNSETIYRPKTNSNLVYECVDLKEHCYLFKDEGINLKWKITEITEKFGRFTAKKATAKFRGRNYTAWFTEEIPTMNGPWKFINLPGLILRISDDAFFIDLELQTIKKSSSQKMETLIGEINSIKEIKLVDEHVKIREEIVNEAINKILSSFPRNVKVSNVSLKKDGLEKCFKCEKE
ncbi:GLPGLI family protein [Aureivirga marina]|uniref:GLPGLI family protein n=1 Tax=Aureivirga marina TaxID=1182451 RepID=UPI0018CA0D4B|nr:GLPGLI family protein [Aureivirga marina]